MNRRSFLSALAALPIVKRWMPKAAPKVPYCDYINGDLSDVFFNKDIETSEFTPGSTDLSGPEYDCRLPDDVVRYYNSDAFIKKDSRRA